MDYTELMFVKNRGDNVFIYRIQKTPNVLLYIDTTNHRIVDVDIDHEINDSIDYEHIHWSSDWIGYEVCYYDVPVVGLYSLKYFPEVEFYLDVENQSILEVWLVDEY